jgi:uncharacterized protein
LKETHVQVFKEADCLQCANCCKTTPALLIPDDVHRISKHLQISNKQFIRSFTIEDINGEISLNSIPCRFLQEDHKCSIYEIRPVACRRYPHTDEESFASRPLLNQANTIVCPAAFQIVKRLKAKFPSL